MIGLAALADINQLDIGAIRPLLAGKSCRYTNKSTSMTHAGTRPLQNTVASNHSPPCSASNAARSTSEKCVWVITPAFHFSVTSVGSVT